MRIFCTVFLATLTFLACFYFTTVVVSIIFAVGVGAVDVLIVVNGYSQQHAFSGLNLKKYSKLSDFSG